jgi:tRNA U34 2-thiouridine synthase MnmA/TrmU
VGAQCAAHGAARPASVTPTDARPVLGGADPASAVVRFDRPERRVAPGQSVVLYVGDEVVGGGIAGG